MSPRRRGSYRQWEEAGIPLTVVFEISSPGNDWREMLNKKDFYEEHGVQEYYVCDPDTDDLFVYVRGPKGAALRREYFKDTFTSPRLKIRFDTTGDELRVFRPDGKPFHSFDGLTELQERETARADAAETRLARLSELGRKARQGSASADEIAELERREGERATA